MKSEKPLRVGSESENWEGEVKVPGFLKKFQSINEHFFLFL
jgi:hypothetical protein